MAKTIIAATTNKNAPKGFSIVAKLAIGLGIIACLVYANTLLNGYALDDFIIIKNNTIVTRGVAAVPELLTTPYHRGHQVMANDLYRPLAPVMFAAEYQMFDGRPLMSHLINILVFAGGVVLLFLLLNSLFDGKRTITAFIAGLLFALHPIHTEVVANIKSRDELLCFFFSFAALLLLLRYAHNRRPAVLGAGLLLFFLALLAKETAITMLAVVPLVFFFYQNRDKRSSGIITVGVIAVAIVYLLIRFAVLHKYDADHSAEVSFIDNVLAGAPSAAQKTATAILILGNYIRLLFVPYPLICDYSYNSIPFVNFANPVCLLSLAAYLLLLILGVRRLIKCSKDPLAFGILFFLITLSLFSNIPFLIGAAMAERFVFFASAGFCWVVALAIDRWLIRDTEQNLSVLKNAKVLVVLVPVCLLYGGMTIARNIDWKDNTTLFKTDILKSPGNSRLQYYMGTDLLILAETDETEAAVKRQHAEEGIEHLKKSLAIYPDFALVNSELGNAYFSLKNYDSSAVYYERALVQNPADTPAMHNLSAVYFYQKKYEQSVVQCRNAIAIDPGYGRGYRNMGSCYIKMGNYDAAVQALRAAIAIEPGINSSYQNIAYAFQMAGNMDSAHRYEAIARQRNPGFSLQTSTANK